MRIEEEGLEERDTERGIGRGTVRAQRPLSAIEGPLLHVMKCILVASYDNC